MIRSTRVRNALTGAFGGGLGWLITEVFANPDRIYGNLTELFLRDALFGAINGVCIGLALGLILNLGMGTQRLLRSVLIGAPTRPASSGPRSTRTIRGTPRI